VKDIRIIIPEESKRKPLADSRGAIKEKMIHGLLAV
jgi:hypothetical protein